MNEHVTFITQQLKTADSLPALLTTSFVGLEMIERAGQLLIEVAPSDSATAYAIAFHEASDAYWALADAPTLTWPTTTAFASDRHPQLATTTAELALVVTEALLSAADKSIGPADRVACLKAVHHSGLVHAALRRTR